MSTDEEPDAELTAEELARAYPGIASTQSAISVAMRKLMDESSKYQRLVDAMPKAEPVERPMIDLRNSPQHRAAAAAEQTAASVQALAELAIAANDRDEATARWAKISAIAAILSAVIGLAGIVIMIIMA